MIEGKESRDGTPGYRALTEGFGFLESARVVFYLHGPRAERVVNGLVTNSLEGLATGTGAYAFTLSAKGRPLAEMRVLPAPGFETRTVDEPGSEGGGDHVWVDVPGSAATDFADLLKRSVPPIFATVERVDIPRWSVLGPRALEETEGALEAAGIEASVPPNALGCQTIRTQSGLEGLIVRRESIEIPGIDLYLDGSGASEAKETLIKGVEDGGGAVCSPEEWDIARVERGLPIFGAEITSGNLPQETGQTERAVSFEKGCYTGQEVVARIHYRGHVNRVLRGVRPNPVTQDGQNEPGLTPETRLHSEGRAVGEVATVVDSPRFGRIGLAYVRTSVELGTALAADPDGPADIEVCELPFTER